MPDNSSQKPALPFRPEDVPLAVRDGVREVRFRLRRRARRLAESVEAVAHPPEADGQPLALLAEPLGMAIRTTAMMLRTADRAAAHLLGADGPFRDPAALLPSSAIYFAGGKPAEDSRAELRAFTQDHFWRYKHWLSVKGWSDVFVHEQGFDRAGQQLMADAAARAGRAGNVGGGDFAPEEAHLRRAAEVVLALHSAAIFTLDPMAGDDVRSDPDALAWHAALCCVLAGEIASSLEVATEHRTTTALVLADEVTTGARFIWERHRSSGDLRAAVVQWLGFVLRHL